MWKVRSIRTGLLLSVVGGMVVGCGTAPPAQVPGLSICSGTGWAHHKKSCTGVSSLTAQQMASAWVVLRTARGTQWRKATLVVLTSSHHLVIGDSVFVDPTYTYQGYPYGGLLGEQATFVTLPHYIRGGRYTVVAAYTSPISPIGAASFTYAG